MLRFDLYTTIVTAIKSRMTTMAVAPLAMAGMRAPAEDAVVGGSAQQVVVSDVSPPDVTTMYNKKKKDTAREGSKNEIISSKGHMTQDEIRVEQLIF